MRVSMMRAAMIGWVVITVAGCEQDKRQIVIDGGTAELESQIGNGIPRGVTVDALGRWSLAKAPELSNTTLAKQGELRSVGTQGKLRLFYERLPNKGRTRNAGEHVMSDLVLRIVTSRLIIDRGCLRLDTPEQPAVRFIAPPQLYRDRQGYLVVGGHDHDGTPAYARVGEPVEWELGNRYRETATGTLAPLVTDPNALRPIHEACGPGPVVSVPPRVVSVSLARFAMREGAVKQFQDMYGVSEAEARRRVGDCGPKRPCGLSPPPPVSDGRLCPLGTRYESALCRTAEGYIRPVPPTPSSLER